MSRCQVWAAKFASPVLFAAQFAIHNCQIQQPLKLEFGWVTIALINLLLVFMWSVFFHVFVSQ